MNENRTTRNAPSHGHGHGEALAGVASQWPTPTAHDQKGQGFDNTNLHNAASSWPTPTTADSNGSGGNPSTTGTHGVTLTDAARRDPTWAPHGHQLATTATDGPATSPKVDLNPRFVEALMGVPPNWLTPSTSVATDSFQRWLQTHSLSSLTVSESI